VLHGEGVTLRPLGDADLEGLAAIVRGPGVREWWGSGHDDDELREELRAEGAAFAIDVDDALAGWLAITEVADPDYRHAGLDIVLAPPFQGRGLGPAALRAVIGWLVRERGHHRFTIDPAVGNERAIRAYEAVGFRPVGVLRRYERGADGSWHDNLLMDLLAEELRPGSQR
jgi:aminoglycoside 6'-N-acetyltransferase